eukprot:scaffold17230_cov62-Phaeocystis_antarctica.AAC.4
MLGWDPRHNICHVGGSDQAYIVAWGVIRAFQGYRRFPAKRKRVKNSKRKPRSPASARTC